MKSLAQELEFRQRMMKYLEHCGVIETANRYHVSRMDLLLGYQKAQEKGYTRSYGCFKRTARQEAPEKTIKRIRKNKLCLLRQGRMQPMDAGSLMLIQFRKHPRGSLT